MSNIIFFSMCWSVLDLEEANALYREEKVSVTEKKARGSLTNLWSQGSRAVICALKIRREWVDKDYLWRLLPPCPPSLPQAPLPASAIRKKWQGNFLSLLSVGDKSVFKETYMLAGKTTAPFSCMHGYFTHSALKMTKQQAVYSKPHQSVYNAIRQSPPNQSFFKA